MKHRTRRGGRMTGWAGVLLAGVAWSAATAHAQEPTDDTARARELFHKGAALVAGAQWGEAIAAFEASSALHPHATTTFNIGACERALSRYTRARATFARALEQSRQHPEQLSADLAGEARALLEQLDALLVHASITIVPPEAELSVDGRPLMLQTGTGSTPVLWAGMLPPGRARPPSGAFELVADPGQHVLTLSRKGYSDAVVNRYMAPGSRSVLRIELERLPATLRVESTPPGAIVTVDGKDFGPAPLEVVRGAGAYQVVLQKKGYEPYETLVRVNAGEQSHLRATLVTERVSIARKWWFWAGAAAVVGGGAALTWALTRPEPEPPPYSGGSTGWVVTPSALQF